MGKFRTLEFPHIFKSMTGINLNTIENILRTDVLNVSNKYPDISDAYERGLSGAIEGLYLAIKNRRELNEKDLRLYVIWYIRRAISGEESV